MMRLDKFLAHAGFGTRKEVKELVRKGRVVVNGQRVKKDDQKIDERQDQIQVDGRIALGGFLRQLLIISQTVVLYIGESGDYLLDVEHLRPSLVARLLTGSQLCLNIHCQTDFSLRASGAFFFALNGSKNIFQIVAVPSVEARSRVKRSCPCSVSRKLIPPPRTFLTSYPVRFIRPRNSSRSSGCSVSAVSMARRSRS